MPLTSPSTVLLRTQSDERLVALARAGHERAFEAIVERYRKPLLRQARRYLSEARAEDALQHAWVAAWTALERGENVRDLRPWLYRIVHNAALNQLRVAGYEYADLREALRLGPAPQDEIERRSVVRQTLAGLAKLPARQRDALLQIAVEGRGQEEVARELGITEGAVRQLVHRARTTLRAAATAFIPLPVATWAAGAAGGAGSAVVDVAAGAGTGTAALLAKAGAVAVLAGGAVAGPAAVLHHPHPAQPHSRLSAARPRAVKVTFRPAATPALTRVAAWSAAGRRGPGGGEADSSDRRGAPGGGPGPGRDDGVGDRRTSRAGRGSIVSGDEESGRERSGGSGAGTSGEGGRSGGGPSPTPVPTAAPVATTSAAGESGDDGHGGGGDGSRDGSGGSGH